MVLPRQIEVLCRKAMVFQQRTGKPRFRSKVDFFDTSVVSDQGHRQNSQKIGGGGNRYNQAIRIS